MRWLWPNLPWWDACELASLPIPCVDSIFSPLQVHWVRGILCVFRCNLPPALLAEWLWSFMCHCGNVWDGMDTKESAQKVCSGEENSPITFARIQTETLGSWVWRSTNLAIPTPNAKHRNACYRSCWAESGMINQQKCPRYQPVLALSPFFNRGKMEWTN